MSAKRLATFAAGTAFAAALTLTAAASAQPPKVGQPAPDFVGVDSQGKKHKLSDLKGKTVILEWTNHDCPFVRKHYGAGNMQSTQKAARKDGIVWLSVISSAPGRQGYVEGAEADRLTKVRNAAPDAVLLDPKGVIGRKYDARTTPHMYLIDAQGTLRYRGAIDDIPSASADDIPKAVNYVRQAVAQLKAGLKIKPSVTRAYGCSVKYAW
ncbi:MAG: redoxin domain-containing protein [Magnetovibrio sp.]|nr:redoxin domain-containing protein [Magnetovibrio sp.]